MAFLLSKKKAFFRKAAAFCLALALVAEGGIAEAQALPRSPVPAADTYRPAHLRSLSFDGARPGARVLLDAGDQVLHGASAPSLRTLLQYFLTGVSLPDSAFWVNLRPDSPDAVIDPALARTECGRIMLEADLQLKKDLAAYLSPRSPPGARYWERMYRKAEELFGASHGSIPAVSRPWIVPGEIVIQKNAGSAYVYKATLKVMLEADRLKGDAAYSFADERLGELNRYSAGLMKELIIPRLTRDVNCARRYAALRQVYYSLILAQWFKKAFVGQKMYPASRADSGDLAGIESATRWSSGEYFRQYRESFAHGEYHSREAVAEGAGARVRNYASGGLVMTGLLENTGGESRVYAVAAPGGAVPEIPALNTAVAVSFDGGSAAAPDNVPAGYLLAALGIDGTTRARGQVAAAWDGYEVRRFGSGLFDPAMLAVLQKELVRISAVSIEQFDLLYDGEGKLLGLFPVFSPLIRERAKLSPAEIPLQYINMSYYNYPLPRASDPGAQKQWKEISFLLLKDREAINRYKEQAGCDMIELNTLPDGPFVYASINKKTGTYEARPICTFMENNKLSWSFGKLPEPDPGKEQLFTVVFPTVYNPANPDHYRADRHYFEALYWDFELRPGQSMLVVGPGVGVEAWLAALRTGGVIHSVGINPFEIANLKATAAAGGFRVEAITGDNIIDENGVPRFSRVFDRITWDMPWYSGYLGDALSPKRRLADFWDGDFKGEALRRFCRGLVLMLGTRGKALCWNMLDDLSRDPVGKIFREYKFDVTMKKAGHNQEMLYFVGRPAQKDGGSPILDARIRWNSQFPLPAAVRERIRKVISWAQSPDDGSGRSGIVVLPEPLTYTVNGRKMVVTAVKVKGMGDFRSADHRQPSEKEIYQGDYEIVIDGQGRMRMEDFDPDPTGGLTFRGAEHEFRMLGTILSRDGARVNIPLGFGSYPGKMFRDDAMGFVIQGITDQKDPRFRDTLIHGADISLGGKGIQTRPGDELVRRAGGSDDATVAAYLYDCYRKWGRALRRLNDAGILQQSGHSQNWMVDPDGEVVIHDFDSALDKRMLTPQAGFMYQLVTELGQTISYIVGDETFTRLGYFLMEQGRPAHEAFLRGYFGDREFEGQPAFRELTGRLAQRPEQMRDEFDRTVMIVRLEAALFLYEPLAAALRQRPPFPGQEFREEIVSFAERGAPEQIVSRKKREREDAAGRDGGKMDTGGIDLTSLQAPARPAAVAARAGTVDEREWGRVERMAACGMMPSVQRLELLFCPGAVPADREGALRLFARIMRLQETALDPASPVMIRWLESVPAAPSYN